VFIVPSHRNLQYAVQLRQGQSCGNQYAAPDGGLGAKQSDLELIDILCDLVAPVAMAVLLLNEGPVRGVPGWVRCYDTVLFGGRAVIYAAR
jgi:hypothetical protein